MNIGEGKLIDNVVERQKKELHILEYTKKFNLKERKFT